MADRNDSVGNLDESWREEESNKNQKKAGSLATMPKDLSKYNLDPYPTLSRESYRDKHADALITKHLRSFL